LIREKNIKLIWNNITELSRNIKTVLWQENLKDVKLITACHWMDCPEINEGKIDKEISYQWRQLDGYECSDLCLFTCESTKAAFFDNASKIFMPGVLEQIAKKSVIFNAVYSATELGAPDKHKAPKKKRILFLNRLSSLNYTCHKEFIDAINKLGETRNDFDVVLTNPSNKVSWDWLEANIKNLTIIKRGPLNREEFVQLLWSGTVSVNLFRERYGGCSSTQALHCCNKIVCPQVFEYARKFGPNYPLYVKEDMSNLVEVLNKALDIDLPMGEYSKQCMERASFEYSAPQILIPIAKLFL
jgi:glycosyltransferase involved in cell wall biosynthesis